MSQNILVKHTPSKMVFPLNLRGVQEVFPGFNVGDFAVVQGASVSTLSSMLSVQAQLPIQLGGLESGVIFIDGGNKFRLYQIARIAQMYKLDPKKILNNIYLSRAFTAYQTAFLIINQLKEVIKKYNAKLVIISDIAGFFLDTDIPEEETQSIFSQVLIYLSKFARENQVIIIATYPSHVGTRNSLLQRSACTNADVVLSLSKTHYVRKIALEKHPHLQSVTVELPNENYTLTDFTDMITHG